MMCPDTVQDCDNPGCRRGGCQGRRPSLPLFRVQAPSAAKPLPALEPTIVGAPRPTVIGVRGADGGLRPAAWHRR